MQKERITDKEALYLVIMFVLGSSLIIGIGEETKNDRWIAGIVGMIMVIPMILIYSRILSLFQGKDLFEILDKILGKIMGKIVALLYIWYAFHLGALVLRNFGEFVSTVALPETPMLVSILCMGLVCIIAVRLGIEVLGRTNTYFFPILMFTLIVVELLGIPQIRLHYLKPILGNGLIPVLIGGFSAFSFPFAETILFLGVFSSLKTKKSPVRVYFWGILISGALLVTITLRNITVLGYMLSSYYFPSYAAVRRINIGDYLQRIEMTLSILFIFGVFIKSSICLLVACKGIEKMFNLKDYRSVAIQTGLLMVYFSYIVYENSIEMRNWSFEVYPYYAFPLQVIIPIIIWILAEVKAKKA
jgi:spore germination protein KB